MGHLENKHSLHFQMPHRRWNTFYPSRDLTRDWKLRMAASAHLQTEQEAPFPKCPIPGMWSLQSLSGFRWNKKCFSAYTALPNTETKHPSPSRLESSHILQKLGTAPHTLSLTICAYTRMLPPSNRSILWVCIVLKACFTFHNDLMSLRWVVNYFFFPSENQSHFNVRCVLWNSKEPS